MYPAWMHVQWSRIAGHALLGLFLVLPTTFVLDDGIAIAERGAVVRDDNALRRLHAFSREGPCMLADV